MKNSKKIKCSLHIGKKHSAIHNDRSFNLDKAKHIDKSKVKDNVYIIVDPETGQLFYKNEETRFIDHELNFYEHYFNKWLEKSNAKFIKKGNHDRVKTIEDIYKSKRYSPQEIIIQIGSVEEQDIVDPKDIFEATKGVLKDLQDSKTFKVMTCSIHYDEDGMPHAHISGVFVELEEDGSYKPSVNKGLEQAGYNLLNDSEERGRYNNRKMVFTKVLRERLETRVANMGYDVDTERRAVSRHKDVKEYKQYMQEMEYIKTQKKQLEEREKAIEERETAVADKERTLNARETVIAERSDKLIDDELKLEEKRKDISAVYPYVYEFQKTVVQPITDLQEEYRDKVTKEASNHNTRKFLKHHNLLVEYDNYMRKMMTGFNSTMKQAVQEYNRQKPTFLQDMERRKMERAKQNNTKQKSNDDYGIEF